MMIAEVDEYIAANDKWKAEMKALRSILLDCQLTETFKWRTPCYTFDNKNMVLMGSFKDHCTISFVKGVLLNDSENILIKPGENSNSVRVIRFANVAKIAKLAPILKAYIFEAIEVEKSGINVDTSYRDEVDFAEELMMKLDENPAIKNAFEALTPGRQRGYNIFFTGAKQAKTRMARVEKYIPWILAGKGMNDCICGRTKKSPNCDGSHNDIEGYKREII